MRSGLNGASTLRTPYPAREPPSFAQPKPRKLAGDRMDWTGGHTAACRTAYTIVTLIITADGDAVSLPGPVSSERAVKCTPHGVRPSKESNMKANVYEEG